MSDEDNDYLATREKMNDVLRRLRDLQEGIRDLTEQREELVKEGQALIKELQETLPSMKRISEGKGIRSPYRELWKNNKLGFIWLLGVIALLIWEIIIKHV